MSRKRSLGWREVRSFACGTSGIAWSGACSACGMHWRIKGIIQKVLGHLPGGDRIHFVLQRRAGGLTDFNRECDVKVDDWRLMMGHLRAAQIDLARATFIEMGTGWYPAFPLCLYLVGVPRIHTLDLHRHLDRGLTRLLAGRLAAHIPVMARASGLPEAEIAARQARLARALERGESLERATSGVVEYSAPADAAKIALPASSVDVVFSNSVLEHVPAPVIEACLGEAFRILRPGGIVFHSVNCGDHYAYIDRAIHQLNYLQYSDAEWARWNNRFLHQNRLRAVDFTTMARREGFAIEIDTSRASEKRLEQLDSIRIHPSFARYTREQLAITSIDFVGRKPVLGA